MSATGGNNKVTYLLPCMFLKVHGKSSLDSELLQHGFALATTKALQVMPSHFGRHDMMGDNNLFTLPSWI